MPNACLCVFTQFFYSGSVPYAFEGKPDIYHIPEVCDIKLMVTRKCVVYIYVAPFFQLQNVKEGLSLWLWSDL